MTQYIDEPYLNGVLSGILLGVAAVWLLYLANALWRARLEELAEEAGFQVRLAGFRPRLRGERGRLSLRMVGGVRGERAVLYVDGAKVAGCRVRDAEDLVALVRQHGQVGEALS